MGSYPDPYFSISSDPVNLNPDPVNVNPDPVNVIPDNLNFDNLNPDNLNPDPVNLNPDPVNPDLVNFNPDLIPVYLNSDPIPVYLSSDPVISTRIRSISTLIRLISIRIRNPGSNKERVSAGKYSHRPLPLPVGDRHEKEEGFFSAADSCVQVWRVWTM